MNNPLSDPDSNPLNNPDSNPTPKHNGPWQVTFSEEKYKNPWISVREDKVIHPDGKPGIFGIVNIISGVSVLAIDKDNNVYLTKEFRYAIRKPSIEVVSGCIDPGELAIDAAKRELKEEIGIIAQKWTHIGDTKPITSIVDTKADLFLAQELEFTQASPDPSEIIEMQKVPLSQAIQMVMNSEIMHTPSCLLILQAARLLGH